MLARMKKKNNTYLLVVRAQTGAAHMEISVDIAQGARSRVTMLFSYTILGHAPKGPYLLL